MNQKDSSYKLLKAAEHLAVESNMFY